MSQIARIAPLWNWEKRGSYVLTQLSFYVQAYSCVLDLWLHHSWDSWLGFEVGFKVGPAVGLAVALFDACVNYTLCPHTMPWLAVVLVSIFLEGVYFCCTFPSLKPALQ